MRYIVAAFCASTSLIAIGGPAFAQSAPAQETPDTTSADGSVPINEILVSARRRTESIQDVPQTVNVVTAEQVENLNLRNFRDIQEIVPGLTMAQANSYTNTATVRGVTFNPTVSGSNPSVEFYLNDAPSSSQALFQTNFDFGQFELQRGPQGTLRGRAAPSGSIAVTTRRPDLTEVGMVMNGTISDLGAKKIDGAFNIPIIANVLGIRIAGVIDEDEGDRVRTVKADTDPGSNPSPYNKNKGIRGSVRLEPTDWLAANLMYQKINRVSRRYNQVMSDSLITGAPRTTPLIEPDDRLSISDQGSTDRQSIQYLIGNLDVRFAGQKLSYVGSRQRGSFGGIDSNDTADFFGPPRFNIVSRPLRDLPTADPACARLASLTNFKATTGAYVGCTDGRQNRSSHELRLASEERIAGIFDYVVGGLYDRQETKTALTGETPVILPVAPVNPVYLVVANSLSDIVRNADTKEQSIFGNVTAHFGGLEISGGLRRIWYKDFGNTLFGGNLLGENNDKYKATVYTGSVKYEVSPDFMVYALTGSSWRPGPRVVGNFTLGPVGDGPSDRELSFTNLPPETSKSYEVGFKSTLFGGRGRFNLAAYYQKFKNYPFRGPITSYVNYSFVQGQGILPSASAFGFVAPVPVTVKGVEAEASYQITDRWSVSGNAAYADGQIKNGTIPCTDLNGDGVPDVNPGVITLAQLQAALPPGERLAICPGYSNRSIDTPKFSANLQSEASFPLSPSLDSFVRGSFSFFGKNSGSVGSTFDDRPAYGLLNLFAGIRDTEGGWTLTAFARNIFDKQFVTPQSAPASIQVRQTSGQYLYTSEYRGVSVSAPREFGIQARIAIGSR